MDMFLSLGATILSFFMVRYFSESYIPAKVIFRIAILSFGTAFISFFAFRTHRNIIRHSSLKSLWQIGAAVIVKSLMLYAAVHYTCTLQSYQVNLGIMLDFLFTLLFLIGIRVAMLLGYDMVLARLGSPKIRILIYGNNVKSVSVKMRLHNNSDYNVVGFLNYGKSLRSYKISELPVFYFCNEKDFDYVMSHARIEGVLFPTYIDARNEQDRLIRYCEQHEGAIKTLIAPPVDEFFGNEMQPGNKNKVRNVQIEDLLGRDEITINRNEIIANFYGKTVMVTGAAGSIGSELCRQMATLGVKQLILFDNAETPMHELRLELEKKFPNLDFVPFIGDVRSIERLKIAFNRYSPQIIFHAAAYKHVPLMEENPCEAVRVNDIGTKYVADLCIKHGIEKMVMISTDKAVNPTNVMGASKRLAEIYIQSLGLAIAEGKIKGKTKFVTTRFGNVLGSNGSVIPLFTKQIETGGPVTVTHPDITRFFMTIPEACRLVMEAATMSKGNDIFVFEMGEPVKIADLARKMIKLAGYVPDKDIEIKYTGLRPGEKLYEEVLSNEENTIPTSNQKIKIAKVREYSYAEICETFDSLKKLSENGDVMGTVRMMKMTVPEYKSNNSEFECLDQELSVEEEPTNSDKQTA